MRVCPGAGTRGRRPFEAIENEKILLEFPEPLSARAGAGKKHKKHWPIPREQAVYALADIKAIRCRDQHEGLSRSGILKEYAAFMSPSKLLTLMGTALRDNAKALHLCGACHAFLTNAVTG